jgi:hypothetical protein
MRQLFKVSRLCKLSVISRLIQDRVKGILGPLAVPLAQSGSWGLFYQLRIWTDRFEISSDAVAFDGRFDPPPPTQGYIQLGDFMGQMIAFRDQLKKDKRWSADTISEALSMAQNAEELGITAEVWKLRLLIAKRLLKRSLERGSFHNDIGEIWRNVNLWRKHFLTCEYFIPLRLIVLLLEL